MKTSTIAWILAIVIIIAGVWIYYTHTTPATTTDATAGSNGTNDQGNPGLPAQTGGTDTGTAAAPIIGANLALGLDGAAASRHLIGYTGMTVYMNAQDTGPESTCTDACAVTWPPYIISAADNIHQLQAGVSGDVGTTVRADGQLQLTYNGHPLYFYKGDVSGSDTKGDGIGNGQWAIVRI